MGGKLAKESEQTLKSSSDSADETKKILYGDETMKTTQSDTEKNRKVIKESSIINLYSIDLTSQTDSLQENQPNTNNTADTNDTNVTNEINDIDNKNKNFVEGFDDMKVMESEELRQFIANSRLEQSRINVGYDHEKIGQSVSSLSNTMCEEREAESFFYY